VDTQVDGVLLDLGMSTMQLSDTSRGFSFLLDGPLDMRMNIQCGLTAAEWLHRVNENELVDILKTYGEERFARRIAKAIVATRQTSPITTTRQLVSVIEGAIPFREKHKHPATRSFQAIRIYINSELDDLQKGLTQSLDCLKAGGRLVVISFHSLEDRLVKQFISRQSIGDDFPKGVAIPSSALKPRLKRVGKAIFPSEDEIRKNVKARSAVLRIAEKIG
jgi:16S rRNA (cytosine1402-N4)-methyltransferase